MRKVLLAFLCLILLIGCGRSLQQSCVYEPMDCLPYYISLPEYPINFHDFKGVVGVVYEVSKEGELVDHKIFLLDIHNELRRINFSCSPQKSKDNINYPDTIVHYIYELDEVLKSSVIGKTECENSHKSYTIQMYFKIESKDNVNK